MESPNKRQRTEPGDFDIPIAGRPSTIMQTGAMDAQDDFISLGGNGNANEQYGCGAAGERQQAPDHAPTGPRDRNPPNGHHGRQRNARNDPRNAKDRPKSKHDLPGYEPWILVRTKFGRRFAHNTKTKESFWYIPKDIMPGVIAFERSEKEDKEKAENQKWAEEQLREMEAKSKAAKINKRADAEEGRSRRRRSESLQREDEEAFMAELAAQAEAAEEEDVKEVVQVVEEKPQGPQAGDYASDSEYEYVEVTDTEGEEDEEDDGQEQAQGALPTTEGEAEEAQEDGPVEFGEDDIAYQLAAMGEEYGLDPGEYGDDQEGEWEEGAEGLPLTEEDAINLFRDMLDDHRISPYTPWDKLITDESADSILMDDRYTILSTSKARKDTWEVWTKDKAALLREERAKMEKLDPRIPYLAFLSDNATPKLYWPEFKRKFKKDAEMNDRKLVDKDREKLYREHINRLRLPESTRKADLITLLKSQPLSALNKSSTLDSLPQSVLGHLHLISLPSNVRVPLIERHIASLPPPPDADEGEWSDEQRAAEEKKRAERRKREAAMAERERQVNEERHRTGRDEAQAKRMLREEQAELARYARI